MWVDLLLALPFATLLWIAMRGGRNAAESASPRFGSFTAIAVVLGVLASLSPLAAVLLDLAQFATLRSTATDLLALAIALCIMLAPWLWIYRTWRSAATRSQAAVAFAAAVTSAIMAVVSLTLFIAGPADAWSGIVLLSTALCQLLVIACLAALRRFADRGAGGSTSMIGEAGERTA